MRIAPLLSRTSGALRAVANLPLVLLAAIWRRTVLRRVTVIAITGSVGKTTAKNCLAAILSDVAPTIALPGGNNGRYGLPRLLLRGRPSHRFLVAEVGILQPGRMWRSAWLLNPDAAVITKINWQHAKNFESLDQIAFEKALLLEPLGAAGLAVLNADDERVSAMGAGRNCRLRTFGLGDAADVKGSVATARWPQRLRLDVTEGSEIRQLQTRLVGGHWAVSVLAAVAAARALGASWEHCERGLASVEPHPGRLSLVRLPSGADLLRDEYNGSFATLVEALEVLKQARAERKVLVLGHIMDAPQVGEAAPEETAKRASPVADLLLFWGAYAERYKKAALAAGTPSEKVLVFAQQHDLAAFLKQESRLGDLILVKGYWFDHMTRIVYEQFGTVSCRLPYCEITSVCDPCRRMGFRLDPSLPGGLDESLALAQSRLPAK